MDDKANGVVEAADDEDLSTTAPNPRPNVWKMPEPVFQKTSGRLPERFETKFFAESETQESPKPVGTSDPNPIPQVEQPVKSATLRIVLVLLGVAAMIGFLILFLTILYFFFLR
ncbi:MAG: hypothetical protein ABI481_01935 [Pyrinomonadaceae bacterium]